MSQEIALSFRKATKVYRWSHLGRVTRTVGLNELSLEIFKGETFGLLGLNGSGKTTTFKLALGLLSPGSGSVEVLGSFPGDKAVRSRIGYLPELPYFHSFLTVEACLRFYGRLSGLAGLELERAVETALGRAGLLSYKSARISRLSKGLSQRVGLAQAVLHDPELLILDEPMSGLDPLAVKDFREQLKELGERGRTILVSSHGISDLERLCQRVGILKEGRLVRILSQEHWVQAPGGLEGRFAEIVQGAAGGR